MKIETERLILRNPKIKDWKDVLEACKELDVSKNLGIVPYPYTKKDAISFVNFAIKEWKRKNQEKYIFFLELKSNGKMIGVTEIKNKDGIGKSGSWINKKYWRKGYITEAKIAVNDFAFNILKVRKLESEAYKENKASNIMQKKMGYLYEGCRKQGSFCKATGKIHDVNLYGLLKKDWKKISPKLKKHLKEKMKKQLKDKKSLIKNTTKKWN